MMQQQQQQYHSAIDGMVNMPYTIPSQQHTVQEPSCNNDTVYPQEQWQQVVINDPLAPPASAMQGNNKNDFCMTAS